mgnify:CR=1 FL=1
MALSYHGRFSTVHDRIERSGGKHGGGLPPGCVLFRRLDGLGHMGLGIKFLRHPFIRRQ